MPVTPVNWGSFSSISANKLNTDLYTFVPGNAYTPNGILFHTQRPILVEFAGVSAISNTAIPYSVTNTFGSWFAQYGKFGSSPSGNFQWVNWWDSAANYGPGADFGLASAIGTFSAEVPGQGGVNEVTSSNGQGYYMIYGSLAATGVPTTAAGFGIGYCPESSTGSPTMMMSNQDASSAHDNITYGIDLIVGTQAPASSPTVLGTNLAVTTGSGSCNSAPGTATPLEDPTGEGAAYQTWWAGINNNGVTVAGGPTPPGTFTSGSTITSTNMNSTVTNTINFLNNPPLLRACSVNATSIPASTVTQVPLNSTSGAPGVQVDTYSGLSTSTYTVPVSGVYLVHGVVSFTAQAFSVNMFAGVQINGTNYWGPAYEMPGEGTTCGAALPMYTALLDLQAGDTVELVCWQNHTSAITLNNGAKAPCRLLLQWLGALGTPSTLWTNPDPGYRWSAGDPNLVADFNAHLTNDLGFLVNRPYLLSSQTTAQTALPVSTYEAVSMQSVAGQVHSSVGDNYSGWNSTGAGHYVCQRAGWYLVVGSVIIVEFGAGHVQAALEAPGIGYNQNMRYIGQYLRANSGSPPPGADFVRMVYLGVGDTAQLNMEVQPTSGSTFATSVNGQSQAGKQTSTFSLIWMGQ